MIQNTEHLIIDIYDKDRQKDTTRNNIINISQSQESTGKWKDPKRKPAVVVPGASKASPQEWRGERDKASRHRLSYDLMVLSLASNTSLSFFFVFDVPSLYYDIRYIKKHKGGRRSGEKIPW